MLQTKIKELQSEISNLTCELRREEKALENLIFNSQEDMVDNIIRCIDKEFRVIENEEVDVMGELDENGNHYSKLV